MKIMVTGCAGYLGSHLIRNMPSEFDIIGVDNLLTQRYVSLFNLDRKIKFLNKDISDLDENDLMGIDVVIHLAAIADAAGSFDNKLEMENVNITKTKNFIVLCKEAKIAQFIFPSSTSVYGVSTDVVYEDDESVICPQSPYAESKIEIENFIRLELGKETQYLILRLGTVFGSSPGIRFHTAVNKFCFEASLNNPLTIWDSGYDLVRPYLGINDATQSMVYFLNGMKTNQTYNVITSNINLKDIIKIIKKYVSVELNMVKSPLLNQYSYFVSDEKIRAIGFLASDDIELAIFETLNLLKNIG